MSKVGDFLLAKVVSWSICHSRKIRQGALTLLSRIRNCPTVVFQTLLGELKPATEHKMHSSHIFEDRGL
jgi:hypothetical protein